jgi:hypothetical protein
MNKFKIGEKVVYGTIIGTILEIYLEPIFSNYTYKVSISEKGSYMWIDESNLKANLQCDCGAKFDRHFPNEHMIMCNTNKGIKNGNK